MGVFESIMFYTFRCTVVPAVNQIEFNPYLVDNDILDVCKTNKIVVQAYAPIGTGTGVRVRANSNASNNERGIIPEEIDP